MRTPRADGDSAAKDRRHASWIGPRPLTSGTATYANAFPPRERVGNTPGLASSASRVAAEHLRAAQDALPTDTDLPGFRRADPDDATLMLCPAVTRQVPDRIVHAHGSWTGTGENAGRTLTVTLVNDPEQAPADSLLATLLPQNCAADIDGLHYVYDRQPVEDDDGWTGALNTILAADTRTGQQSYRAAYLLSTEDALLNVIASRTDRGSIDPSVDETAAHAVKLVQHDFTR